MTTVSEIFIAPFFFELHFRYFQSCVHEIKACHLTIDGSNWFMSVPLHLAMKWRTCNASTNRKRTEYCGLYYSSNTFFNNLALKYYEQNHG